MTSFTCAFSVFISPAQRMGLRAFSSSVVPAASIMRNSENGGCSKIILIRDNTGKQCKAVPTLRKQADSVYTEPACFMLVGALPQSPQNTKTVFWNDG